MITIIDYNAGNLFSVKSALERLGEKYVITSKKEEIERAEKIIFPGVGRASQSMNELKKLDLIETIKNLKVPFLGICLGAQLLFDFSEEDNTKCLSIISGDIKRFQLPQELKIPHIGWNNIKITKDDKFTEGISDKDNVYFVHSYYIDTNNKYILGKTEYGISFTSIVKNNNFYGVQFHPEKSGKSGEKLLQNFISL